jgi:hypothetical protein
MGFLDFIPVIGKILDRVLPDKAASEAAKLKVMELTQSGELAQLDADVKLATGQMDINKIEAANPSLFVSGWRPAIGWICGSALGVQFLVAPLATWVAGLFGHPVVFPSLDMGTLMTLLAGMLGLGTLRTVEKTQGVARQ